MSTTPSTSHEMMELSDEKRAEIEEHRKELERLEEEAPRYDVEYLVGWNEDAGAFDKPEQKAVMTAHGMLTSDLDGEVHVPITTNISPKIGPAGKATVTITVAAEVKKSVFEKAESAYLANANEFHWVWCLKEFDPENDRETVLDSEEAPEWHYPIEEVEMRLLR